MSILTAKLNTCPTVLTVDVKDCLQRRPQFLSSLKAVPFAVCLSCIKIWSIPTSSWIWSEIMIWVDQIKRGEVMDLLHWGLKKPSRYYCHHLPVLTSFLWVILTDCCRLQWMRTKVPKSTANTSLPSMGLRPCEATQSQRSAELPGWAQPWGMANEMVVQTTTFGATCYATMNCG